MSDNNENQNKRNGKSNRKFQSPSGKHPKQSVDLVFSNIPLDGTKTNSKVPRNRGHFLFPNSGIKRPTQAKQSDGQLEDSFILTDSPGSTDTIEPSDEEINDALIGALFPLMLMNSMKANKAAANPQSNATNNAADSAYCTLIVDQIKQSSDTVVQELRSNKQQSNESVANGAKLIVNEMNQFRTDLRNILLEELPKKINDTKKR